MTTGIFDNPAVFYISGITIDGEYCKHGWRHIDSQLGMATLFTRDRDEIPDGAVNVQYNAHGYSYDLYGEIQVKVRDNTPMWARRALGLEPAPASVTSKTLTPDEVRRVRELLAKAASAT